MGQGTRVGSFFNLNRVITVSSVGSSGTRFLTRVLVHFFVYTTVCLGKTKSLGVLKGLSTDKFGIIKRAKHSEGDTWKSAFEW